MNFLLHATHNVEILPTTNKLQCATMFYTALISSHRCINDGNNEKLISIDICPNYVFLPIRVHRLPVVPVEFSVLIYRCSLICERFSFYIFQTVFIYVEINVIDSVAIDTEYQKCSDMGDTCQQHRN